MPEPVATIRSYGPQDEKLVRFMIGKASMELLASANNSIYWNPLFVAIWIALSSVFVQYAGWWPSGNHLWQYLRPLPGLASVAVPLLFAVDWLHRPEFEGHTRAILGSPDLRQLENYYSKSSASGIWILQLGDTFVGLVAVDCSEDGNALPQGQETPSSPTSDSKLKGRTGTIRHFYVAELYRPTKIQDDLLKHAIEHAFSRDPKLDHIQATGFGALLPYTESSLRRAGFLPDSTIKTMGIMRWKVSSYIISRKTMSS